MTAIEKARAAKAEADAVCGRVERAVAEPEKRIQEINGELAAPNGLEVPSKDDELLTDFAAEGQALTTVRRVEAATVSRDTSLRRELREQCQLRARALAALPAARRRRAAARADLSKILSDNAMKPYLAVVQEIVDHIMAAARGIEALEEIKAPILAECGTVHLPSVAPLGLDLSLSPRGPLEIWVTKDLPIDFPALRIPEFPKPHPEPKESSRGRHYDHLGHFADPSRLLPRRRRK